MALYGEARALRQRRCKEFVEALVRDSLSPCGRGCPSRLARGGRGVNSRGLADFFERELRAAENELVGKARDSETLLAKPRVPAPIVQALFVRVVRRAIELDDQSGVERDEVRDVAADRYLPLELEPVETAGAERLPDDLLCASHGAALVLGGCPQPPRNAPMGDAALYQTLAVVHPSPGRLRRGTLSRKGRG